jgi:PAS domain S-box-containing protein
MEGEWGAILSRECRMANQISRIQNRVFVLVSLTTIAATVFMLLVIPVLSELAPRAARTARLYYLGLGVLFVLAIVLSIRFYLRPISDLGYALEIGSTPALKIAEDARRIAFNAPVYLFVLPTLGVLCISLLANVLGSLLWSGPTFAERLWITLLRTAVAASASLVMALVCRRLMRPVLLYTAMRVQTDGIRLNIRTRLFTTVMALIVLALLLPGSFGYVHTVKLHPDHLVEATLLYGACGVLALVAGALICHYLAADLAYDLSDITSRLLDVAHGERVDLSVSVPVLSLDEVGDLVRAFNALQEQVRIQQEQIEFKQRQLMALQSLSYKIGTIRDADHLLQEVIRDVERAFGYHNVSVLLADERGEKLYFAATGLLDTAVRARRFRIGEDGVVGRVAATGTPLLINDVSKCDFYISDKTNTRSELAVPLALGDEVIGVFNVSSERIGAFEDSDLRIVTALGNQVAIAIENARLFDQVTTNANELERRARNMTILNNISNSLSMALRLEDVLQTTTEQLVALFDIGHCSVLLFGEEDEFGHFAAEYPDKGTVGEQVRLKGLPVIRRVLAARTPLYIADAQHSEQLKPIRERLQELDIQSTLIVPLMSKGIIEGIINLNSVGEPRAFTSEETSLCRTITAQVAVSVENVRLFESLRAQADMLARMARDVSAERSQLDAILRNLADGLLVTDPEGNIVLFNPAFLHLFNLSAGGLQGKLVTRIVPELPLQNLIIQTAQATAVHVQEMTLPDGRHFQITAAGVHEEGKLSGVVMVLRDVTRERQLDAMKSDFISTVSHELRTPLTPVLGFAKLIQKAHNRNIVPVLPPDEKAAQRAAARINQNLDILITEVEHLSELVDDVLFLADLDAGRLKWKMADMSLHQILEQVVDQYRPQAAAKGLVLRTDWCDDLPQVIGDKERLIRVVRNLVSNAVKFTDEGEVSIGACPIQRQDGTWHSPPGVRLPDQLGAGPYVLVTIRDTGPGISPEAQQTLFERFGQGMGDMLTEKPAGTGLGLALSKEIVTHHNGWIWIESEGEKGSTFAFVLPLSPESADLPQLADRGVLPETAPTILVVDDEPAVRELLYYVLLQAGYRSLMAVDGPTALNMARAHKPDLIILDIMIPGISGLDVTSVLKADESTRDIPIVILSILADEQKAAQLGAEGCFSKPFDQGEFIQTINELLARSRSTK